MVDNDVQNRPVENSFRLTRVGITGVEKPITVLRPGNKVSLVCRFEVSVDLPSTQKGSHMSRNVETINEVVDRSATEPCESLEALSRHIARRLLDVHPYANNSSVSLEAPYFMERTFGGRKSLERYTLLALSEAKKGGDIHTRLGVTVCGMTVCPCAMENVKGKLGLGDEHGPGGIPVISHNQRNETTIFVQVNGDHEIEAEDLIDLVEEALSSPTFEYLKRDAEANIVINAHNNPRFVEDVVRGILGELVSRYPDLPDHTTVHVRSTSQESIHKHDAFAERSTTLGELRE